MSNGALNENAWPVAVASRDVANEVCRHFTVCPVTFWYLATVSA